MGDKTNPTYQCQPCGLVWTLGKGAACPRCGSKGKKL